MPQSLYDKPEIEYLDGRAYPKVSPKFNHSLAQGALIAILQRCGKDRGFTGPELRLDPGRIDRTKTEFVPDVSFVSFERLKGLDAEDKQKPPFSPDIAVEVRSPSDDLHFLAAKIQRYLRTGSILVLDVDTERRAIRAHAAAGVREFAQNEPFECSEVPWLRFDVYEVFEKIDLLDG